MRGFFAGLIWGTVAIAVVAAVMSLLSPLPSGPDVVSATPTSGAQTNDPSGTSGVEPTGVDADLVNAAPTVPNDESTTADNLTVMQGADTDPAARPEVGGDSTIADPDGTDTADTIATMMPDMSQAPASTGVPSAPEGTESAPDDLGSMDQADTLPAHQPEVGGEGGAMTGPDNGDQSAGVVVNSDTPVAPVAPGAGPTTPQDETDLALSSDPTQPAMPVVSGGGSGFGTVPTAGISPDIASGSEAAPASTDSTEAVTQSGEEPAPMASTTPAEPPAPRIAALPQSGASEGTTSPTIGKPVVPLTERGASPDTSDEAPSTIPPIDLYGEPFSNPENKPLMAIILIDDEDSVGVEALANFPQPLTMAIDPTAPDAAEKMARHRAAGFEVVLLIDLPALANAQDAEVSLAASFATLPEVVAVLEGAGTGVQGNRALADQVSAIVESLGYGLILQNNGLNTVYKLAVQAGIPAGVVFRDFDGAGQNGKVMRRFLDQAAFRAGQNGGVIMLGRVRPNTVSALLLWALQDRATRVALSPVSAVLKGDDAQ